MKIKISKLGLELAIREGLNLREFVYLSYVAYYNQSKSGCTVGNKTIANDLLLKERNIKTISMSCIAKGFMETKNHNAHRFVCENFKEISRINENQKSDFFNIFTPIGLGVEIQDFNKLLIFKCVENYIKNSTYKHNGFKALNFQSRAIGGLVQFVCNILPISDHTVKSVINAFANDGLIVVEDNKIVYLPINDVVNVPQPQNKPALTFASVIEFLDNAVLSKEEKVLIFSKII